MQFAKVFIQNKYVEDTCQVKKEETVPNSMLTSSVKGAKAAEEHLCGQLKETVFKGDDKRREKMEAIHQGNSEITTYRCEELKDIFLAISKELPDKALEEARSNKPMETLDAEEISLVEDLREIGRIYNVKPESP